MRILFIGPLPPVPGKSPESEHNYRFLEHLAHAGLEMHVLTEAGAVVADQPNITTYPVMNSWGWDELPLLLEVVRGCEPDVVLLCYLCSNYNGQALITFAPTLTKALRPDARFLTLVQYPQGPDFCDRGSPPAELVRRAFIRWAGPAGLDDEYGALLRDSDRLLLVGDFHRAKLRELDPTVDDKAVMVTIGPLITITPADDGTIRQQTRAELGVGLDEELLIYFGYIYAGKGIDTLLRAYARLRERRPGVRLALVGGTSIEQPERPNYVQEMLDLSAELRLAEDVIWLGEFDWCSDLPSRCLRAADLCVLPFERGLGTNNSSFSSAAVHGLPVVATRGMATGSHFVDGQNVLTCSPHDPEALATVLETALNDPDLRARLGQGAYALVQEQFSWDRIIADTVNLLNELRRS